MTEEQLNKQTEQQEIKVSADKLPENNRRRLIKGAAAVVPVIMTLHSGAALARTSNLVGAIEGDIPDGSDHVATMNLGDGPRVVCVYPDDSEDQSLAPPYDLGEAPMGKLIRNFKKDGTPLSLNKQAKRCRNQGGLVISATAFSSFEGRIAGL